MPAGQSQLLSIVELGGYPNYTGLYEQNGYQVDLVNSQRKARNYLKKNTPDVIVCEYNFQTDFRDRTSNLETLMAILQKKPGIRLIVFYMPEHQSKLDLVRQRFDIFGTLAFPVDEAELSKVLQAARELPDSGGGV